MPRKQVHISINKALDYGWKATSHYIGFYLTLVLLILLFNLVPSVFETLFDNSIYTPVVRGIFVVLIAIVTLGIIRTTLKHVDHKDTSLLDLFRLNLFGRYIATAFIYLFMLIGGFMLLIIPGVYWGIKYQFATYLVVDKRLEIAQAFEESARIVAGHEWDLLSYWLVMFLLNLAGILFFTVGIVVTLPVTLIGYSYIYRQLRQA